MKELSLEECKSLQLKILVNIDQFCKEHDIKYSIAYGTLIGAVRHKGFIPWDDDIDIIMLRDEYEKFVALYKDINYELVKGDNIPNHLHIRVTDPNTQLVYFKDEGRQKFNSHGLWVDIFPIDKVPEKVSDYNKVMKKIKCFVRLQRTGELWRNNILTYLAHIFLSPFPRLFSSLAKKGMLKYNNSGTKMVANLAVWFIKAPSFPSFYMDDYIKLEFEGHLFSSISHYDDFLKGVYGNYMQFPPLEKQVPHHYYNAYLKGSQEENNKNK